MYKYFALMWMNMVTKDIKCLKVYSRSEHEAIRDFRECYRHGNYKILSVVEIPE